MYIHTNYLRRYLNFLHILYKLTLGDQQSNTCSRQCHTYAVSSPPTLAHKYTTFKQLIKMHNKFPLISLNNRFNPLYFTKFSHDPLARRTDGSWCNNRLIAIRFSANYDRQEEFSLGTSCGDLYYFLRNSGSARITESAVIRTAAGHSVCTEPQCTSLKRIALVPPHKS